jgi:hypothetical protein
MSLINAVWPTHALQRTAPAVAELGVVMFLQQPRPPRVTTSGGSNAHRDHHCWRLCALGSLPGNSKVPCEVQHYVHDYSNGGICRHLVCGSCFKHVDWRLAGWLFVPGGVANLSIDIFAAGRGSGLGEVEVSLSKYEIWGYASGVLERVLAGECCVYHRNLAGSGSEANRV